MIIIDRKIEVKADNANVSAFLAVMTTKANRKDKKVSSITTTSLFVHHNGVTVHRSSAITISDVFLHLPRVCIHQGGAIK